MTDRNFRYDLGPGGGGGGTPLCDINGDVRPDRVWFSGCFVLNGVSISSLSVLNRVSLHDLMA